MMSQTEMPYITLHGEKYCFHEPQVMGILNVTPDSFYAGSRKQTEEDIAQRTNEIISQGATMIDIGACSTRPGSEPVSEEGEMARLRKALVVIRREQPDAILSVDTFRPNVAKMCVEEFGVDIINDVSEGCEEMFRLTADLQVPYILMSTGATAEDVKTLFVDKSKELNAMGCDNIILDPGYGFGKDIDQNFSIMKRQQELRLSHYPLLVGISRKRMIWQLLGITPDEALNGTSVVNAFALLQGADILRVHDVKQAVETIKIIKKCF